MAMDPKLYRHLWIMPCRHNILSINPTKYDYQHLKKCKIMKLKHHTSLFLLMCRILETYNKVCSGTFKVATGCYTRSKNYQCNPQANYSDTSDNCWRTHEPQCSFRLTSSPTCMMLFDQLYTRLPT